MDGQSLNLSKLGKTQWDAKPLDEKNALISAIESHMTQHLRWYCDLAEAFRIKGEKARTRQNASWYAVVAMNITIALVNSLSLIKELGESIPYWILPLLSIIISLLISAFGLIKDARKFGQVANTCDELSNDLSSVETAYQALYLETVNPMKPEYESYENLTKIFHQLCDRRIDLSKKITQELSRIGEKKDPSIISASSYGDDVAI